MMVVISKEQILWFQYVICRESTVNINIVFRKFDKVVNTDKERSNIFLVTIE